MIKEMDTGRKSPKPRKKRSIRIRTDPYQWVEERIKKGKFQSFSHAIDLALEKLRDSIKSSKSKF
jgi:Arc/MetJ-type ribon-helix-helix transcriptional regulator